MLCCVAAHSTEYKEDAKQGFGAWPPRGRLTQGNYDNKHLILILIRIVQPHPTHKDARPLLLAGHRELGLPAPPGQSAPPATQTTLWRSRPTRTQEHPASRLRSGSIGAKGDKRRSVGGAGKQADRVAEWVGVCVGISRSLEGGDF